MKLFCAKIILIAAAIPAFAEELKPVTDGTEGRRAFDELTMYYSNPKNTPVYENELDDLHSPDPAKRTSAGKYLLALLKQSKADESNGRVEWTSTPFWGGGSESVARNFRETLANKFGENASKAESLEAALWLINEDFLAPSEVAGVQVICRIESDGVTNIFRRLLEPHPNEQVANAVIKEVRARGLKELAPEITRLCTHYRSSLREAARTSALILGIQQIPEFKADAAFTAGLDALIRTINAQVWPELKKDAKFMHFTVTTPPYNKNDKPHVAEFSGWILSEDKYTLHVLDFFGAEETLQKDQTKSVARSFADEAQSLLAIRNKTKDKHEIGESLSRQGGLTGQFEADSISAPEALVATWSYMRGDKASAAAILFPRIDAAPDDRWIGYIVRDLMGHIHHQKMLYQFSQNRDYAATRALAQHLSKEIFNDYQYQKRAKELEAQLARRMDDFRTFVLPEANAWDDMKKKMNREDQIRFLAEHLRLLNCIQTSQPGGVSYRDPQTGGRMRHDKEQPQEVINPFNELEMMKLQVADLPALIPFLADENYMPTYSYWRDFHPSRTLHQVNWAVGALVNDTAKRDLAELQKYFNLDAAGKKAHIEKILVWCRANTGLTRAQLLLDTMKTAKNWREFRSAATEAAQDRLRGTLDILLQRMQEFSEQTSDIASLCFKLGDPAAAAQARRWLKDAIPAGDQKNRDAVRFWATLILLGYGDKEHLEGLSELSAILEKDDGSYWYPRAIETLLSSGKEELLKLSSGILKKEHFEAGYGGAPIVHRLLLAGRKECLNYLVAGLANSKSAGTSSGIWNGQDVERKITAADETAGLLAALHADKFEYHELAPDDQRTKEREDLEIWLKEQFALITSGKPHGIKEKVEKLSFDEWRIDAP